MFSTLLYIWFSEQFLVFCPSTRPPLVTHHKQGTRKNVQYKRIQIVLLSTNISLMEREDENKEEQKRMGSGRQIKIPSGYSEINFKMKRQCSERNSCSLFGSSYAADKGLDGQSRPNRWTVTCHEAATLRKAFVMYSQRRSY